jgi:HlyD family secretion protein
VSEDIDAERAKASGPAITPSGIVPAPSSAVVAGPEAHSPVPAPQLAPPRRSRWMTVGLALVLLGLAAGGGAYWWVQHNEKIPAGIAWSNGRIEADDIDIATKFPGRVAELLVQEGDMVNAGQVVARMDTRDLEASLRRAEAQVQQAGKMVEEARSMQEQQHSQVTLAQQQFDRTAALVERGNATRELLDQRRQQLNGSTALLNATTARVAEAENALGASQNDVELYRINIADNTLVAPRDGRIQYRIANIGEVLPAGGRVMTMIDVASVYMDVYLPTVEAGQAQVGSDARIVLDAYPDIAIPAKVSFIASQSQFTPKTVETRSERDRLMFRVRVRVDPELLKAHAARVRSGLPGIAYVRLDPKVEWPARLQRLAGQ